MEVVFGAYCSTKVIPESRTSSGDERSFLFSLFPKCNSYRYQENSSTKNFVYLSKEGLGFGGKTAQTSRIWIDSDMKSMSSVKSSSDSTYQPGSLVPLQMANREIPIDKLEVWLLSDEDRKKQILYLISR